MEDSTKVFKIFDVQSGKFWAEVFTPMGLAKSHRFPSNAEKHYRIVQGRCDNCGREEFIAPGMVLMCAYCDCAVVYVDKPE